MLSSEAHITCMQAQGAPSMGPRMNTQRFFRLPDTSAGPRERAGLKEPLLTPPKARMTTTLSLIHI